MPAQECYPVRQRGFQSDAIHDATPAHFLYLGYYIAIAREWWLFSEDKHLRKDDYKIQLMFELTLKVRYHRI